MSQFSSRFLQIDQPCAERIIAGFGSPLFIIDEPGIVQRLQEFIREARALYEHSIVALSYKTNPLHGLLSKLHQQDVYAEVVSGDEYRIARSLNISTSTVKVHVSNILHKLNASTRTQAASVYQRGTATV